MARKCACGSDLRLGQLALGQCDRCIKETQRKFARLSKPRRRGSVSRETQRVKRTGAK